jgi:hypothetical protein
MPKGNATKDALDESRDRRAVRMAEDEQLVLATIEGDTSRPQVRERLRWHRGRQGRVDSVLKRLVTRGVLRTWREPGGYRSLRMYAKTGDE